MALKNRFDFYGVMAKVSTWLGLLTLAQGGAMIAFSQAPPEWKALLPDRIGGFLLIGMMACGALTPIASSFKQKKFMTDDTDKAGA